MFGIDQAFSGRYQSFALLFWCCMAVLFLGRIFSLRPRGGALVAAETAIFAAILFAAQKAQPLLSRARWHGFNVNLAAIALETDVPDNAQLAWAHSQPDYPRSLVPFLRSHRLSVFTDPAPYLLGLPLDLEFKVGNSGNCEGKVESISIITGGRPRSLRIKGWAWDSQQGSVPSGILFATDGTISGLGVVGDVRSDQVKQAAKARTNYIGFTGYVRDVSPSSTVDVYAIPRDGDNAVCRIASVQLN